MSTNIRRKNHEKLAPIPRQNSTENNNQYNTPPPFSKFSQQKDYYEIENEPLNKFSNNNDELKPKSKPSKIIDHKSLINDKEIQKCFPVKDRGWMKLRRFVSFNCAHPFRSYVDLICPSASEKETSYEDATLKNKCAYFNILHSSNLELDPNVMHPFVKIHLVDMTTGNYIQKTSNRPAVSYYETITTFRKTEKTFDLNSCDIITPFATKCYDLRESGNSRAIWNEVFYVNEEADAVFNPKTVILIEVLDFNKRLIAEKRYDQMNQNLFYRVAWGYLRPMGPHRNHFGISRIQLFRHKFQYKNTSSLSLKTDIPHVYYDFIWPYKKKYDGYITMQVLATERPPFIETMDPPKSVFEIEKGEDFKKTLARLHRREDDQTIVEEEISEQDKVLFKRRRLPEEPCQVPNKILYKFQTAKFGCFKLAFSHNGKYLAAACTQDNSKTIIKIFDVDDGTIPFIYKGHRNIIHDLDWSLNDRFLISSSSDYTSVVWKVPKTADEVIDEDESEKSSLLCVFNHPSYVYGGKIMPEKIVERLIIATICFDGKVRIWLMEYNQRDELKRGDLMGESLISVFEDQYETYTNLLDHRHPNTLLFKENGSLYIGDSLGMVHIFDVKVKFRNIILTRIRTITHSEIEGDAINSVYFKPAPDNHILIIHSRDNCIRAFEENQSEEKVLSRYFGSKSSKYPVKSIISPDGNFVLSGSEDGKPYLWNFANKELQDSEVFQLSLMDLVSDVAWSNNFHVIACSGFGKEYPILVYFWERDGEINVKDYKYIMEKVIRKEREEMVFQENPEGNFGGGYHAKSDFYDRTGNQENPDFEGSGIRREKDLHYNEGKKMFKRKEKQ